MTGSPVLQALKPSKWLVEAVVRIVLVLIALNAESGWRLVDSANVIPESLSTVLTVQPNTGFATLKANSLMRSQPGVERRAD
jgi:predicted type IV restriction endonuclease